MEICGSGWCLFDVALFYPGNWSLVVTVKPHWGHGTWNIREWSYRIESIVIGFWPYLDIIGIFPMEIWVRMVSLMWNLKYKGAVRMVFLWCGALLPWQLVIVKPLWGHGTWNIREWSYRIESINCHWCWPAFILLVYSKWRYGSGWCLFDVALFYTLSNWSLLIIVNRETSWNIREM